MTPGAAVAVGVIQTKNNINARSGLYGSTMK